MMFNATFNNIPVILWRSALLVEETRENHLPASSHWQTLYTSPWARFNLTTLVVICMCINLQVVVNPTTIQSPRRRPRNIVCI